MAGGRKPIEIERAGMKTQRDRMWEAIRRLRTFTLSSLQDAVKPVVPMPTVEQYVRSLKLASYLRYEDPPAYRGGPRVAGRFTMIKDSLEAPAVTREGKPVTRGIGMLAMWRAMQTLREFDFNDIARAASLGDFKVRPSTAREYIAALEKAGYFLTIRGARAGLAGRYRLKRDTGALPPALTARNCVFDRNLGKFTWEASAQEVADAL